MNYIKKNKKWLAALLFLMAAYNLYFIFLLKDQHIQKLCYLDILLAVTALLLFGADAYNDLLWRRKKESLLPCARVIRQELQPFENLDIAEHDACVLEEQLHQQFDQNCDLQDYLAKWFHEAKIPLSACLLMNEKIQDAPLRTSQKEQLEKIRQLLHGALLGCKIQSRLLDLQIRSASLDEIVKSSIHNNQYFLIQKQFEIDLRIEPVQIYTDPSWLTYVLDQLIQNAVKYSTAHPLLRIQGSRSEDRVSLSVYDNGEGILDCDIRRIFERGFTGSNHHNGKYKSTGMGLYMAAQILEKLGHEITVESEFGSFTKFTIQISQN